MEMIGVFVLGFIFSFLGSVPPGVINISIIQLSATGNLKGALEFGVAAALVEVLYSFIAVKFQMFILSHEFLRTYLHLISAVAMLVLGVINFISSNKQKVKSISAKSGFWRGLLICLFNPFLIPFWVFTTAYLINNNWLTLTSEIKILYYILGISIGAWALHILVALLGSRFSTKGYNKPIFNKVVGVIFTLLGLWALVGLL